MPALLYWVFDWSAVLRMILRLRLGRTGNPGQLIVSLRVQERGAGRWAVYLAPCVEEEV